LLAYVFFNRYTYFCVSYIIVISERIRQLPFNIFDLGIQVSWPQKDLESRELTVIQCTTNEHLQETNISYFACVTYIPCHEQNTMSHHLQHNKYSNKINKSNQIPINNKTTQSDLKKCNHSIFKEIWTQYWIFKCKYKKKDNLHYKMSVWGKNTLWKDNITLISHHIVSWFTPCGT